MIVQQFFLRIDSLLINSLSMHFQLLYKESRTSENMRQQPKKQCRRSCQLEENIYLLKLTDSIIMFLKELTKTFLMEAREKMAIERRISTCTLEQLIGPLNDVEKKYAPKHLYVSGQLPIPLPSPRVAVIGSRKASIKGLTAAGNIARVLAEHKVIVVSGLAEGIDSAAHNGAINANGHTIAVLGTPLDKVYPRQNAQLQDLIMRKHLAVSQFPIGYPIQPKNFVIRNRTMALIADASIIVEAGNSSVSVHQGWERPEVRKTAIHLEPVNAL